MKKITVLVAAIAAAVLIAGCSDSGSKNDKFNQGYEAAMEDYEDNLEMELDAAYEEGYEDGYADGSGEFDSDALHQDSYLSRDLQSEFQACAESYASGESGWHPEEAWEVIECYREGESYYGETITKADYEDAVDSLIYFYEYFYAGRDD